jgi:tRNA A-37 threonylcarbamoyl transferase component Bud32
VKTIDQQHYLTLVASATVLERDAHGAKVLALPGGEFVKLFRRKRWLSSALFFPYARRFIRNAARLARLGIPTVTVLDAAYCPAVRRHLVTYRPLPGMTLRQALAAAETDGMALLREFAQFVALLHQRGVYFRSLHLGNVIVPDQGTGLGLIDVADMSISRSALPAGQRARNFRHMLRYREDVGYLKQFGSAWFLEQYFAAANLALPEQKLFSGLLD